MSLFSKTGGAPDAPEKASKYFVKHNNKLYGPVEEQKLIMAIQEGFFPLNCQISVDRLNWMLPEQIFQGIAGTVASIPNNAENDGGMNNSNFGVGSPGDRSPVKKTNTGVIVAVVLVIVLLLTVLGGTGFYIYNNYFKKRGKIRRLFGTVEQFHQPRQLCRGYAIVMPDDVEADV